MIWNIALCSSWCFQVLLKGKPMKRDYHYSNMQPFELYPEANRYTSVDGLNRNGSSSQHGIVVKTADANLENPILFPTSLQ